MSIIISNSFFIFSLIIKKQKHRTNINSTTKQFYFK